MKYVPKIRLQVLGEISFHFSATFIRYEPKLRGSGDNLMSTIPAFSEKFHKKSLFEFTTDTGLSLTPFTFENTSKKS